MIDMDSNKVNKFLLATTVLSILILLVGTTFSYFTISNRSKLNAMSVEAGRVKLGLGVSDMTSGIKLIPTRDEDIMIAYKHNCIDDYGFGACNIFEFSVSNFSNSQDVIGNISFDVKNIEHLSYIILDENDNIYLEKTSIPNGISSNLSLGEHFILEDGSEVTPSNKVFKLVIWLSNLDKAQDEEDAGGTYSATVTYSSVNGNILTGTVNGIKASGN